MSNPNQTYEMALHSTIFQPQLEKMLEGLEDLAERALDKYSIPASDNDDDYRGEIAIAYLDRIRYFLVNGDWPGDDVVQGDLPPLSPQ